MQVKFEALRTGEGLNHGFVEPLCRAYRSSSLNSANLHSSVLPAPLVFGKERPQTLHLFIR